MYTRPLIGIAGLARSGKDTFASFLKLKSKELNEEFETYAFADPLKLAASQMFGLPLSIFYGGDEREEINEDWGISPREMLQKLGTEGGREIFGSDLWIKRANVQFRAPLIYGFKEEVLDVPFCVTDVRFNDEADWIREHHGIVVHIRNDNVIGDVREHASEEGVTIVNDDIIIMNNGTLEELEESANDFYGYMKDSYATD